jgi:hypothetical protein
MSIAPPATWTQTRAETGAFASLQRASLPFPAVEASVAGARRLGELYWDELERSTRRLLRMRSAGRAGATEISLLGIGPALLRFGPARVEVTSGSVMCSYPIVGGVLSRRTSGSISFTQTTTSGVEVSSEVHEFFPRLATRRLRRRWKGLLYPQIQTRLHAALGRRYFARLRTEAAA